MQEDKPNQIDVLLKICFSREASSVLLQVLVAVLVLVVVLGGGQQARDVADAFGDALPEQQLGSEPQVLGVLDEAELDDGPLARPQLLLRPHTPGHARRSRHKPKRNLTATPTFPWSRSTMAVCLTFPTCTVTCEPRRKVLAWKSRTMAASN